jgi:hypothetical protein
VSAGNLFHSHQVVAVGYDDSGTGMRMFIYDCRTPDVTAVLTATGASCTLETPGQAPEPWRAFFVERYAARTPTYVDLSLVAPAVVTPIDDGQATVRFTVRNSGDADAHLAAIGVRVGDALLSPTEPVGTLAPGGEASFEHDVKVGDTAPQPIYTDASGHQFVLPSST